MTREETADHVARYVRHWDEHGFGLWAAEERTTGRFVGRIGLQYHRLWPHDPEVGWGLDPAVWGRGYATEGGAASIEHAFGALGFARVVSIVLPANVRSIRVMERLGLAPWRRLPSPWGELDVYAKERDSAGAESARPGRGRV
jgi:RimJ/RimL family protein N-acetyltransferase